jgi:hypothetical protein
VSNQPSDNDRLLAHPLPNLQFAVYVPALSEDSPVAIFQDFSMALDWSLENNGQSASVRKIRLFSDRMPVADPIQAGETPAVQPNTEE